MTIQAITKPRRPGTIPPGPPASFLTRTTPTRRRDSRLHENLPIDTHYHFPALIPPQSSMLEQFSLGKAEPHAFSWLALRLRMTETGGRMRDFGS